MHPILRPQLLVLAVLAPLALLAQTNVALVNASFEDSSGYFDQLGASATIFDLTELPGWSVTALGGSINYAGANNSNPPSNISGANTGFIGSFGTAGGTGDFNIFTRAADLPAAVVGNTYNASIGLRDDTFNSTAVTGTFFLEFFDASKVVLIGFSSGFTVSSASATSNPLETVSATGIAPVGAAFVGIRINLTSSSLLDNAILTTTAPIPEPASSATLVGLALLVGIGSRRRRS
jgi:MYXO-CTERM domain-containing protein